jgi:hypothetical protein
MLRQSSKHALPERSVTPCLVRAAKPQPRRNALRRIVVVGHRSTYGNHTGVLSNPIHDGCRCLSRVSPPTSGHGANANLAAAIQLPTCPVDRSLMRCQFEKRLALLTDRWYVHAAPLTVSATSLRTWQVARAHVPFPLTPAIQQTSHLEPRWSNWTGLRARPFANTPLDFGASTLPFDPGWRTRKGAQARRRSR